MHLPLFIRCWFAVDLVIALLPPIHWLLGDATPVFGVPCVLLYLFGSSVFIASSVAAAYFSER